jgi:hypothetical protein
MQVQPEKLLEIKQEIPQLIPRNRRKLLSS